MSWDSPIHSFNFAHGEPPTPVETPTSTTFGEATFQTPKIETSFYDPRVTWNTSDPYASSPDISRTPKNSQLYSFSEATERDQVNRACTEIEIARELASHAQHPSPNPSLSLPPVEPSRQLSSSPNPNSAKRTCIDASEVRKSPILERNPFSGKGNPAASMQTPPPTSTTGRRAVDLFPPPHETSTNRRMSSPNVTRKVPADPNQYQAEASPQLFSNLQFSPDLYSYPLSGPATAPIFPQHRLFWDDSATMQGGPQPVVQNVNAYGGLMMDPFSSPQPINDSFGSPTGFQPQDQFQLTDQRTDSLPFPMASGPSVVDGAIFPPPFVHHSAQGGRVMSGEPGLFLSSPARRFGPVPDTNDASSHPAAKHQLQPYFHQNEETRREREYEMARKTSNKRSPNISNPSTKGHLGRSTPPDSESRPALKRSLTHTGASNTHVKRVNQVTFASSGENQNRIVKPTQGRSSPSKGDRYASQVGSEPRTRTSLTLVIDENGRAKTVPTVIQEESQDRMDVDDTSGGGDSDMSPSEDFDIAYSRNTSFAAGQPERRKPHLGPLKSDSSVHSKTPSYSSTEGSSGPRLPTQTSGPFKQPALPLSVQGRASFRGEAPSESETVVGMDVDTGDAQYALKQVMRDRKQNPPGTIRAHRPSYSGPHPGFAMADPDSSPTTITDPDVATPSTGRGSSMSGTTRCVCNSNDNGGHLMIQW